MAQIVLFKEYEDHVSEQQAAQLKDYEDKGHRVRVIIDPGYPVACYVMFDGIWIPLSKINNNG